MKVLARDITPGMTIVDVETGAHTYVTDVADEGVVVIDGETSYDVIDGIDYGMEQDRWVTCAAFDTFDIVHVVRFA